jgi:hypothetical protein
LVRESANVKTLNHSQVHAFRQPRGSIRRVFIAAGLAAAVAAPAWAAELPDVVESRNAGNAATDAAVDPESVARGNWRKLMAHNSTPATGCFHASYPNIVWERVACKSGQPRFHPLHARPMDDQAESTGGTTTSNNDSVIQVTSLITGAFGFFTVSGVTTEDGVSEFNNPITGAPQGTLGPNEYSIQLNTNDKDHLGM